jgi:hypothetical protein
VRIRFSWLKIGPTENWVFGFYIKGREFLDQLEDCRRTNAAYRDVVILRPESAHTSLPARPPASSANMNHSLGVSGETHTSRIVYKYVPASNDDIFVLENGRRSDSQRTLPHTSKCINSFRTSLILLFLYSQKCVILFHIIVLSWKNPQYVLPTLWNPPTKLHCVTTQKNTLPWEPKYYFFLYLKPWGSSECYPSCLSSKWLIFNKFPHQNFARILCSAILINY